MADGKRHRVVIVGGGFAGVQTALGLRRADVDVTLVDRRNFHLFQPLLYQVATGGLSPGDIAAPIRTVLRKVKNARVLLGDVVDIDAAGKHIVLDDGATLPYDTLVICTGARHAYFGNDKWEPLAPGLKTLEDATEIRARVLRAFEQAERATDEETRKALLTFVVVGGGPTGVELAGALGELARHTMLGEFRAIDSARAKVLLLEGTARILSMYDDDQAKHAIEALASIGAEVRTETKVVGIDEGGVDVEVKGQRERIPSRTVLWAAGVAGSPLARCLEKGAGAKLDRAGRVVVEPDCTVPGHPEIFVLGDLANWAHDAAKKGAPLPGVCPVALQMGAYCARVVHARLASPPMKAPAFRYFDKGNMAVIGRNQAVARVGFGLDVKLNGFLAWLAWAFVHILYLVDYENRALVAMQWANHYFTRNRGARLISHDDTKTTKAA